MNYDDPQAFYDMPGLFYDMAAGPVLNQKQTMAKPKLNLQNMTVLQKIQKANDIVTAMTGNANFTTPNPSLATVTTKADAAAAAFSAREQTKLLLDEQQTDLETAEDDLEAVLTALMGYAEAATLGDAAKLQSGGFEIKGAPAPIGPMPQVLNLTASANGAEGVVTLKWKAVKGAASYEVQASPDPFTASSWVAKDPVTKAVCTLAGLPSSTRCWFRVRAVATAGPGPYSDPAVKTVP
jgi:hypothetical protein